jgi:hypothetical protein
MDYRGKDRWLSLAFGATAIFGKDKHQQEPFLVEMLGWFVDVPDAPPDENDIQAYAKFAVKLLLRALLDKSNFSDNGA